MTSLLKDIEYFHIKKGKRIFINIEYFHIKKLKLKKYQYRNRICLY